ncbi:MAG: purine-nucleoside phosphorylase [Planctomyces sp.]
MTSEVPQLALTMPDRNNFSELSAAVRCVHGTLSRNSSQPPRVGVILGSGLGDTADSLAGPGALVIPYAEIPGMPVSSVAGHAGQLWLSRRSGSPQVAILQGRSHYYEGFSSSAVTFGVRLLIQLGIQRLIITNAAGGIRPDLQPGSLMLISGHLLFPPRVTIAPESPETPASSETPVKLPHRMFGDLIWSQSLIETAETIESPLLIGKGTYAMMPGPCYETPAEIRMLRTLGADAVGMSTVPEALCAAESGVQVLGVSVITNVAAGLSSATLNHHEVTQTAASIQEPLRDWLTAAVRLKGGRSSC